MTLYNIINSIQGIALTQPNVRTTDNGSIYDKLDNNPAIQYGVVFLSQTNHREDEQFDYYGFNIFYIDRLDDTMENNRLQIQSIGKEVLSNTIRTFCNTYNVDMPTLRYQPFTQKFDDECAGVYVSLELEIMKDYICDETYDEPIPVPPLVIRNQTKSIDVIENGHYTVGYDAGYTGLEKVNININIPQNDGEFLYNFDYEELDYDFANEYFERHAPVSVGGCSAIRSGNFVGRHLDWKYDWEAMAFIRTPHNMGVAGGLPSFTIAQIESGLTEEQKKILPFMLQDGINEHGLFAEINVVPAAGNTQTPGDERICSLMLVRYILDHYDSVDAAIEGLSDKQIFFPTTLTDMGYESHYMIADSAKTAVLEIIDNTLVAIEDNVSTNFHLYGVSANTDGTVYTPETAISGRFASNNGIEEYGTGLERYNILKTAEIANKQDMENTLNSVLFTKAYTEPWPSEFVGVGEDDITVDTPANDPAFVARIEKYQEIFNNRSRDTALTWNTCHASIYDIENKVLYLKSQEKNAESVYRMMDDEGSYEEGYASGYTDGHVIGYTEGYTSGHTDGIEDQKAKLVSTAFTENGTFEREDGFNSVTVDIDLDEPYAEGYMAGVAAQKSKLAYTAVTENGLYEREDGFRGVNVDIYVPEVQSSKSVSYTENGVYSVFPDGDNDAMGRVNITVDVPAPEPLLEEKEVTITEETGVIHPSTGYDGMVYVDYNATPVYNNGYYDGYSDGHSDGYEEGESDQKDKLISTAITENGTYSREDGFSSISVNVSGGGGDEQLKGLIERSATHIDIPAGITTIGAYVFYYYSSLTGVTIPDSVTSIGARAFQSCSSLTGITIPNGVTSIGLSAFNGCSSLTGIILSSGLTSIGNYAFQSCSSLTGITIPDSVISIGTYAFESCSSLTGIILPSGLTSIGSYAFQSCSSLTGITIPNGVTSISEYAFHNCSSLTGITIPNGVTSIGTYAFESCSSLTGITIPDGVTSISNYTFRNCKSLTGITIPAGVTKIGTYAFNGCSGLTQITCLATVPPTLSNANALTNTNNCPIYVPAESVDAYKTANYWSTYAGRISAIPE